ncbi:MAG: sulfurtransferase, partial [Gammaproteobacteria bacterium]|nr:sulfurtransferase [Gammaproteobacteria bacterium]
MNPDTSSTEFVVSTDWLADNLNDPNVRVLDVTGMLTSKLINRAQTAFFDEAHIP